MAITKVNNDLLTLDAAQPTITSVGTLTGLTVTGEITANGGIALGDGDELTLGDSDEFKIKHHASGYTHLQNTVGTLYIDSDSVTFRDDDGSPSNMVISQTGIDVTGTVLLGGATNKAVQVTSSTSNAGYFGVYQDQAMIGVNRDVSDGTFADTGKCAASVNLQSQNANSFIKFATASANNTEPTERVRIDKDGNVLVGTTTAGTKTGDGVIAFGSAGGVMNNFSASVANNGTLDIAINTPGGGYQGFLSVANTVATNAASRTQSTFSVFGRSTDSTIQQIHTDTGTTSAATFTVTTPSNGVIRVTNTSGSTTVVSMQFFGGTSG